MRRLFVSFTTIRPPPWSGLSSLGPSVSSGGASGAAPGGGADACVAALAIWLPAFAAATAITRFVRASTIPVGGQPVACAAARGRRSRCPGRRRRPSSRRAGRAPPARPGGRGRPRPPRRGSSGAVEECSRRALTRASMSVGLGGDIGNQTRCGRHNDPTRRVRCQRSGPRPSWPSAGPEWPCPQGPKTRPKFSDSVESGGERPKAPGTHPRPSTWASTGGIPRNLSKPASTLRPLQDVLSVSNEVAAELATVDDVVLSRLRDRLGCTVLLRGNRLTLEGDEENVREARAVLDELVELVEGGHAIGAGTVDAVLGALEREPRPARRLRRRRLAPPRQEDHAEDGEPEALRGRDPQLDDHVRDRPRRHRQDVPRDGARRRRARGPRGEPDHPHPSRRRGRRAARVPARATCSRRSIRTCARSTTRSTTCSTPTA